MTIQREFQILSITNSCAPLLDCLFLVRTGVDFVNYKSWVPSQP